MYKTNHRVYRGKCGCAHPALQCIYYVQHQIKLNYLSHVYATHHRVYILSILVYSRLCVPCVHYKPLIASYPGSASGFQHGGHLFTFYCYTFTIQFITSQNSMDTPACLVWQTVNDEETKTAAEEGEIEGNVRSVKVMKMMR